MVPHTCLKNYFKLTHKSRLSMMKRELDFVKEMFDSIAPRYDFLNRLLSLRQDVLWRRLMVSAACLPDDAKALDVACGTCDVALEISRQKPKASMIIGIDFSPGMLGFGKKKIAKRNHAGSIHLAAGNALALPFRDNQFDAVFIAFGIRNIMDRKGALTAFHSCLKPGGRVTVLELTSPSRGPLRNLYLFYFKKILPALGGLFSKNSNAYHYLPDSVLKFPSPDAFGNILKSTGYTGVKYKPMTLGIVTLFVGKKPTA